MSNIDKYEQLQSDTIKLVRFPLIIGVIMLHINPEEVVIAGQQLLHIESFPFYDYYKFFFNKVLDVRMPLYFFISGYLFFNRADVFTKTDYIKKLKRRKDTLLVPYLSWLLIYFFVLLIQQTLFSEFSSGNNNPIVNWGIYDIYYAIWKGPLMGPLWYIRDLMCLMVFSPIIYFLVKRFRIVPVIAFILIWIIFKDSINISGLSLVGLAFFSVGAYFSITKVNFVRLFAPHSWIYYSIFFVLVIISISLKDTAYVVYFNRLIAPIGSIVVVLICSHLLKKNVCKPNEILTNSCFFIYVYHNIPTGILLKLSVTYLPLNSSLMLIITHILCTTIIVGMGVLIYYLIKKHSPLMLKLLCGGR